MIQEVPDSQLFPSLGSILSFLEHDASPYDEMVSYLKTGIANTIKAGYVIVQPSATIRKFDPMETVQ